MNTKRRQKKAVSTALQQIWAAGSGHMGSSYRDRRQHPSPRQVPGCPRGDCLRAVPEGGLSRLRPPPQPQVHRPLLSPQQSRRHGSGGVERTIFTDRTFSYRKCLSSAHGPKTSWKTKQSAADTSQDWRARGSQPDAVRTQSPVRRAKGSGRRASPATVPWRKR